MASGDTTENSLITDTLYTDVVSTVNVSPGATGGAASKLSGSDLFSIIVYWTTGCIGVFGNIMVLIVFRFLRSKRSQANLFILNQSLADLVTSMFIIAFATTRIVRDSIWHGGASGFFLCRFWWSRFFVFSGFAVSTFNLAAMSIERYIAVVHPLKYQTFFTKRNTTIIIVIVWFTAPLMQWVFPIWQYMTIDGECAFQTTWKNAHGITAGVILFFWEYFIPCIIMSYAYITILRTLRFKERIVHAQVGAPDQGGVQKAEGGTSNQVSTSTKQAQARRRNVTVTLFILFIVYFVCWTPNQFTFLQFNLGGPLNFNGIWYHFTVVAAFCNTCINPFIYALKHKQFQKGLKTLCRRRNGAHGGLENSEPGTVID